MFVKNLCDGDVLKKINELKEKNHSEETINKMEIFRSYVNIDNKELKKEKINNYVEKYL